MRRGKNRGTQGKTSRSKDENQQQIQTAYDAESSYRTWATWWEASALTAAPSLLPHAPSLWTHFNFTFKGEETFHTHRNLVRATAYYLNARDTATMTFIHSEGRFTTYIQPWQRNTSAPVQCCRVAVFMYSGNDSSGFQHT